VSLRRIALGLHRKRVAKEARASVVAQVKADRDDYERRWLEECRAHGETKRKLEAAEHELTREDDDIGF
jgi:ribosomal protein L9